MTTSRRLRWWLLFAAISAVTLVAAFLLDPIAEAWISAHQDRGVKTAMRWVSYIGDWQGHALAGLLAAGIAHLRGNRRWVRVCVAMLVALALSGAVARVVKIGAGRSRPSVEIDAGFNGPRFTAKYHAFPSGHTAGSVAFFGVLAFAKARIFALLVPIPLLIGFSRMYLTAHHFSDVIGGAVLGLAMAALIAHWRKFEIEDRQSETET